MKIKPGCDQVPIKAGEAFFSHRKVGSHDFKKFHFGQNWQTCNKGITKGRILSMIGLRRLYVDVYMLESNGPIRSENGRSSVNKIVTSIVIGPSYRNAANPLPRNICWFS